MSNLTDLAIEPQTPAYDKVFNRFANRLFKFIFQILYFQTLLTSKDGGINFSNPTSLSVFENVLYFGDSDSGEIWAVDSLNGKPINLTKGHPTPLLKADLASRLLSLHVYHPVMQRQAEGKNIKTLIQ